MPGGRPGGGLGRGVRSSESTAAPRTQSEESAQNAVNAARATRIVMQQPAEAVYATVRKRNSPDGPMTAPAPQPGPAPRPAPRLLLGTRPGPGQCGVYQVIRLTSGVNQQSATPA